MNNWVHDFETLSNCFVACFEDYKTNESKTFVVHNLRNDFKEFIKFLHYNKTNKEWHISYNGLAFDGQITQYILDNYILWENLDGCDISKIIYIYANKCIHKKDTNEWQDYAPWNMEIQQIDLFKMNHWDNPAKRSSLKWIQYGMDWENILEMPIHHTTEITTLEQIDTIIEYCLNDIRSTKEVFKRSVSQIKLRKELSNTYNIDLYSASEPRISKEIFAYYLSQELKINKKDLKKMKTYRSLIKLNDIMLPYIKFESEEFKGLLTKFKSMTVKADELKGTFAHKITYKGVETSFGLGGVHGARKAGVYKSDDDYVIMTSDVTSFYPNLAIRNQWSPAHFPKEVFCKQYEWFFDQRKIIPKKDPMNYVFKIILNSTYGLSNEVNSFFYDPEFTMRITVNGQLSLMMLYEMIMENIPDAVALMQNTDGIETRIPRKHKEKYLEICAEWEKITNLQLEHDEYQKMILADVNNYIALNNFKEVDITTWREVNASHPHYLFKVEGPKFFYAPAKMKGRFDFHELPLHKNKSKLVIPKAIYQYFVHNVLPYNYLKTNKNILDYCIGATTKGDWQQMARSIKDGVYHEEPLQKINRYYISKRGIKIVKVNKTDSREIQLEAGKWLQTIYNKMIIKPKWEEYDVDINYYMTTIEQEIDNIIQKPSTQLPLL
jgi:hypothetical protein